MLNCFTAVGRVAQRTVKRTGTGMLFIKFTLAIAREKDKKGEVITDFINCAIIGNSGVYFDNYAEKGCMLSVQGSMRTFTQDRNGQKVTTTECLVSSYKILIPAGVKMQQQQTQQQAPAPAPVPLPPPPPVTAPAAYPAPEELLPFDVPPEMYGY